MNDKAKKIIEIIEDVIDDDDVQPGFPAWDGNTNTTWCNRALHRMLVMLGGNADLIVEPRGIGWTNANAMALHARKNCEKVIDGKVAQSRANVGDLIAVVAPNSNGSGHVALVCPDTENYDESRGPKIGQAGMKNGIMYTRSGFAHLFPVVEYYFIPLLEKGCAG